MIVPLSASHEHSLANLRKTPDDVIAEVAKIVIARNAAAPARSSKAGRNRLRLHDPG
jgi:hydroxymethylglutaryl-CoA lyase